MTAAVLSEKNSTVGSLARKVVASARHRPTTTSASYTSALVNGPESTLVGPFEMGLRYWMEAHPSLSPCLEPSV